jgi:hypothetical protein
MQVLDTDTVTMTANASLLVRTTLSPKDYRARLTKGELEFQLQDDEFLADFEDAWGRFLRKHPNCFKASTVFGVSELERKLEAALSSKEKLEVEIEQQMAYFKLSCAQLNEEYAMRKQQALERQDAIRDELTKHLEEVASVDELQQQTLPCHYFMNELDKIASKLSIDDQLKNILGELDSSVIEAALIAKPSARALALTSYNSRNSKEDFLLRAHGIDHALLNTNIAVLVKDLERYEKAGHTQDMVSKFLTDNHVWDILNHETDASECSS